MIPDHARLVFKGDLFQAYRWEQELFDGTTTTFECVRRIPTVQLLVVKDAQILLLEEEQPRRDKFYGLPGGQFDSFDEQPEDAAARELHEESPFTGTLSYLFKDTMMGSIQWETHYYVVKPPWTSNEVDPEAGERIEPVWLGFDECVEVVSSDSFRNKGFANKVLRAQQDGVASFEYLVSWLQE